MNWNVLEHVGLFKLKYKENGYCKGNCYYIFRKSEGFQFDAISGNFHFNDTVSRRYWTEFRC